MEGVHFFAPVNSIYSADSGSQVTGQAGWKRTARALGLEGFTDEASALRI